MNESSSPDDYNETNELAKERNRGAADRTLLAWIRTSIGLIAFGFGIERIVETMTSNERGYSSTGLTAFVTLSFIALGIYGIIFASRDYRRELRSLLEARYEYRAQTSHTLIVAAILAVVGAVAFVGILVQVLFIQGLHRST